jgi:hypothetical protein
LIGRWKTTLRRPKITLMRLEKWGKNDHKERRYSFDVVLEWY